MAPDPLQHEYAWLAADYERRWRQYLEYTTQRTLQALEPQAGERILDAGCGTGFALTRLLARHDTFELTGLDASPDMLEQARTRLPAAVQLIRGDLTEMPFATERFDAVITMNALHFLDDPAQAVDELKRVIKPGGRLVITDWCRDFFTTFICEHWLRLRKRPLGRVLGAGELAAYVREAGLRVDAVNRFRVPPAWGLMTLRAYRPD